MIWPTKGVLNVRWSALSLQHSVLLVELLLCSVAHKFRTVEVVGRQHISQPITAAAVTGWEMAFRRTSIIHPSHLLPSWRDSGNYQNFSQYNMFLLEDTLIATMSYWNVRPIFFVLFVFLFFQFFSETLCTFDGQNVIPFFATTG